MKIIKTNIYFFKINKSKLKLFNRLYQKCHSYESSNNTIITQIFELLY